MLKLFPFQERVLEETKNQNKVAYYLDMGLGKTFVGAEKAVELGKNVLVICQKSKIDDWYNHFLDHYNKTCDVQNLTEWVAADWDQLSTLCNVNDGALTVFIINYELAFRRSKLAQICDFTLVLDESSLIQNENAKRSKFILNKLQPSNIILLSGTPTSGKYETLWSQLHLLGWSISKDLYWKQYVDFHFEDKQGFPLKVIDGYKNVDRLKTKMRSYGCVFMKTEEVFDLPEQSFNVVKVDTTKEYRKFRKHSIVELGEVQLVGDTTLNKMLYERMLCGQYNQNKLDALEDLLESTEDRLVVFYNFNAELQVIEDLCLKHNKPVSIVNGQTKDLSCYEEYDNSVTLIQYQAGSMGLNLQKANRIVYFTLPLSSELFEQSKKRIHRIGQKRSCFYYLIICRDSLEEKIHQTLEMRKDYTDELFRQELN